MRVYRGGGGGGTAFDAGKQPVLLRPPLPAAPLSLERGRGPSARAQMGPTDLHKAASARIARGAFLFLLNASERAHTRARIYRHVRPRARVSFIKGAGSARARIAWTQKRRACLVALTIRPPTYEISRFIIIPVSILSLSLSLSLFLSASSSGSTLRPLSSSRFFSCVCRPFAVRASARTTASVSRTR
jgi:hypothetical protein